MREKNRDADMQPDIEMDDKEFQIRTAMVLVEQKAPHQSRSILLVSCY